MIVYQKLKDKGKYKVYEFDFIMGIVMLVVLLVTIWGGINGLMSSIIWPIVLVVAILDLFPFWYNYNYAILSKKKTKKEGNMFSTKEPLIWYLEK